MCLSSAVDDCATPAANQLLLHHCAQPCLQNCMPNLPSNSRPCGFPVLCSLRNGPSCFVVQETATVRCTIGCATSFYVVGRSESNKNLHYDLYLNRGIEAHMRHYCWRLNPPSPHFAAITIVRAVAFATFPKQAPVVLPRRNSPWAHLSIHRS